MRNTSTPTRQTGPAEAGHYAAGPADHLRQGSGGPPEPRANAEAGHDAAGHYPKTPIEVGILGATGTVGQQFIRLLDGHPWFRASWLAASERSEGRPYEDTAAWRLDVPIPDAVRRVQIQPCTPGRGPALVFSALDAAAADTLEPAFAAAGHIVVSNARSMRMDPAVPLLIPEVNPEHLDVLPRQRRERGWKGAIVTNPNCSTVVLAMTLAPLRRFGLRSVIVTTLQAVSGAGYPGVPSLDIIGNVIPNIPGEEAKVESETQKILGALKDERFEPHDVVVSAHTTRVPVVDGHTMTIALAMADKPSLTEVRESLASFRGRPQEWKLPSAPAHAIVCLDGADRPQPRFDAGRGNGMTVTVGRIRSCPVLGTKLVALGHNTVRGAAGAALLNAELMASAGLLSV